MAGYIGKFQSVTQVDGYTTSEADSEFVNTSGDSMTGNLSFGDNDKAIFGAGSDLQIYHDGNNSYVADKGTGNLVLQADASFKLENSDATKTSIFAQPAGAVQLKYDNATKLATTNTGIDVTGTVTADGLTVDVPSGSGAINFNVGNGNQASFIFKENNVQKWNVASVGSDDRFQIYNYNINGFGQTIAANNDISFYEDTGATPKFFWDASAESLGIGTSSLYSWDSDSGLSALQLNGYGALWNYYNNVQLSFNAYQSSTGDKYMTSDDAAKYVLDNTGSHVFYTAATGTAGNSISWAERMRIDSSGNVGIGTSSPSELLDVYSASTNARVQIQTANSSSVPQIEFRNTQAGCQIGMPANVNAMAFTTGDNERMRIDSSGNVLVGDTAQTGTTSRFYARQATDGGFKGLSVISANVNEYIGSMSIDSSGLLRIQQSYLVGGSYQPIAFDVGGSERMRIDSSGALLVGTTSSRPAEFTHPAGFSVGGNATGQVQASTDAATCLLLNRDTSDGTIAEFRKDGTTVGSIGSYAGLYTNLGTSDVGLMFNTGAQAVIPHNMSTNAPRDNAINLGQAGYRWKNLYLSGNVSDGTNSASVADVISAASGSGAGTIEAWVNFNGTGTVSIRDSGNVSSITDNGTGLYTVNFATAMPDTDYAFSGAAWRNSTGSAAPFVTTPNGPTNPATTTALSIMTSLDNSNEFDMGTVAVAIFR